jgi:Tol biopolymer transport system component
MNRSKALFVSVVAAAGIAAAGSSDATTPGRNGLIAYQQEVNGGYQLFTIRPDGTGIVQITHLRGEASTPGWSPDGKLIAFTRETPPANGSVALISPQGTGFREVTPAARQPQPKHIWNGNPVFTPDGKSIVFVRDQGPADSGIWIMGADGSGLRRLTRNPFVRDWDGGDVAPSVSPDGKRVSFVRIKKEEKLQALFTVGIDGTGLRQVTPYTLEVGIKQDWSPDGKLIVLITNADFARPSESANVATIRPDGTHLTAVTRFTGRKQNAYAGSFSPDGKQIVLRLEQGDRYALAVVDRNGQNLRLLTRLGKNKRSFIAWGPRP